MSDCYFPWCGVDGRKCADCAREERVEAMKPEPVTPDMPDEVWDHVVGQIAFMQGEPWDWHESEAWQIGFGDAIGVTPAPELDGLEPEDVFL